tara:strand:+ start:261 stop:470 length:210 start_codon:yes stop_codon:yes gene_type:complete
MTDNFKMISIILLGIIALVIFQIKNSDYNLNRTISACIVAQKQTSQSFDIDKAREFCKTEITKKTKEKK